MTLRNLVKTSYSLSDVVPLLQDLEGKVEILDTAEREKRIQSGTHYSEMLPLEYKPTAEYMKIYDEALSELSYETAVAVAILAEKLYELKGRDMVIVSLARAGTPIGILVRRYLLNKYDFDVPHYTISIIRGKGFDKCAMCYLLSMYRAEQLQFLDGWVGKGAINTVLKNAVDELLNSELNADGKVEGLSSELAVLSDPAYVTDLCGTHADFLIPSACLNATVSGLISRTVKLPNMTDDELHGAVYYKDYEDVDKSIEFINEVSKHFGNLTDKDFTIFEKTVSNGQGRVDLDNVMKDYNMTDINLVKPGVGETTRVLLRRVPEVILIREGATKDARQAKYLQHILRLAEEKNVPVKEYPLVAYSVIGVIKQLGDI